MSRIVVPKEKAKEYLLKEFAGMKPGMDRFKEEVEKVFGPANGWRGSMCYQGTVARMTREGLAVEKKDEEKG